MSVLSDCASRGHLCDSTAFLYDTVYIAQKTHQNDTELWVRIPRNLYLIRVRVIHHHMSRKPITNRQLHAHKCMINLNPIRGNYNIVFHATCFWKACITGNSICTQNYRKFSNVSNEQKEEQWYKKASYASFVDYHKINELNWTEVNCMDLIPQSV